MQLQSQVSLAFCAELPGILRSSRNLSGGGSQASNCAALPALPGKQARRTADQHCHAQSSWLLGASKRMASSIHVLNPTLCPNEQGNEAALMPSCQWHQSCQACPEHGWGFCMLHIFFCKVLINGSSWPSCCQGNLLTVHEAGAPAPPQGNQRAEERSTGIRLCHCCYSGAHGQLPATQSLATPSGCLGGPGGTGAGV